MRKAAIATLGAVVGATLLALGVAVAGMASTGASSGGTAETTSEETTTPTTTTEGPTTTPYKAALTAAAEVPKPKGIKAGAGGAFTLKLTSSGASYSVTWTLIYRKLTGKAGAAHLHRGKPGKAGPVLVGLCGPCRAGQKGKASVSKTFVTALKAGSVYVNVHTTRNAAGEVRGQVKKAG